MSREVDEAIALVEKLHGSAGASQEEIDHLLGDIIQRLASLGSIEKHRELNEKVREMEERLHGPGAYEMSLEKGRLIMSVDGDVSRLTPEEQVFLDTGPRTN